MRIKAISVYILLFTFLSLGLKAENIRIGLFHEYDLNTVVVTPQAGTYELVTENGVYKLSKNSILYFTKLGDKFRIRELKQTIGVFTSAKLVGTSEENYVKIKPIFPSIEARYYDDHFIFTINGKSFQVINEVNIDNYLAGVVETEGGPSASMEFYKSQAIICRTYAYKHHDKHNDEGFNLCDGTHCQAYKGRNRYNPIIKVATISTSGKVIADENKVMITAAFHSNSGGQTANSEDVWVSHLPYLRAVNDPYALKQRNAEWKKTIPLNDWISYLNNQGLAASEADQLNFYQHARKKNYVLNGKSIAVNKIRLDWELKSGLFNMVVSGNKLVFQGKGYGHGVGLCQEGAMNMSDQGFTADEIIHFYYTGVQIIDHTEAVAEEPVF